MLLIEKRERKKKVQRRKAEYIKAKELSSVGVCVHTIKVKRKPAEGKRKRKEGSGEE